MNKPAFVLQFKECGTSLTGDLSSAALKHESGINNSIIYHSYDFIYKDSGMFHTQCYTKQNDYAYEKPINILTEQVFDGFINEAFSSLENAKLSNKNVAKTSSGIIATATIVGTLGNGQAKIEEKIKYFNSDDKIYGIVMIIDTPDGDEIEMNNIYESFSIIH